MDCVYQPERSDQQDQGSLEGDVVRTLLLPVEKAAIKMEIQGFLRAFLQIPENPQGTGVGPASWGLLCDY